MKARRIISMALAICLILTCFAGCGESKSTDTSSTTSGTSTKDETISTESGESSFDATSIFTERDLDPSYKAADAKSITLSGSEDIKITEAGIYILKGTLNASIVVNVEDTEKVQLVLSGVNIKAKNNACVLIENADKVFITLADGTTNTLTNTGSYASYDDITNIDACIFSKDDLTLNGTGALTIDAIGHGIVSKNDLKVTGGVYDVTSDEHALSGKESVLINDGTFTLSAGEKGIKSKNGDETGSGIVYIGGGSFTISAGTEGIEGTQTYISGGKIDITAKDDGINASSEFNNDTILLEISGGYLHINASGDGVDSNGSITVTGGESYISGAINDGDCAFDFETNASVTGGVLVATGMSGMAEIFDDADQGVILYNTNSKSTDSVILKDSSGNELINWTPDKQYNSVLITCPDIKDGSTYTVNIGSLSDEIEMDGNIYGSENALGGGMGGGFGGGGMQQPGGTDPGASRDENDPGANAQQGGTTPQMPQGGMQQGGGPQQGGQMPSDFSGGTAT